MERARWIGRAASSGKPRDDERRAIDHCLIAWRRLAISLERGYHRHDGKQPVAAAKNGEQQKRAEENFERSRSLISATLESTADGVLVVNHEGQIINCNQKFWGGVRKS